MSRKLLIVALSIVALHIGEALTLGTSALGSLLANTLQMIACGFAMAMTFGAFRRGRGLSRPFWLLVGSGIAMWGMANVGWMYYEVALHAEPPTGSLVRFLFGLQSVPFALALFLDQDKDSPTLDAESLLDFIQIVIVFFFLFVGFYYLPAHHFNENTALARDVQVETGEDIALVALALVQTLRARADGIRKLYAGLTLYLLFYTVCAAFADYMQTIRPTPTGTLLDLAWTLPLLSAALWAAQWKPSPAGERGPGVRRKTFGELMVTNATFALAPLIVLLQISQIESEWRVARFSLLGVSILCYAARLGISQFREAKSAAAVQTHSQAMEAAGDGVSILSERGEHTYVNSAFAKMIGFDNQQAMLGKTWREVYDPRDVALLEDQIRQTLRHAGRWAGQVSLHRRDGTKTPIEMTITLMLEGGTICVARDITDRLKAEQERVQTEAKYRAIIEQVAAVSYIAELGVHGRWHYVSPQVQGIFGYTPEEWLADEHQWIRSIPPEDHSIVEAAEAACLRGERYQAEYRIRRKNGQVIWVSDTAVVVPGSDNRPMMEGVIVDITDRKLLENQLQQARKMEAVGRLAGGVAHDFNNLLTIIKGYLEIALNRCAKLPELRKDIHHVDEAADRAVTLVRQLLAFSRKQVLKPKVLDLNSIVLNLDKLLRRVLGENIEMKTIAGKGVGAIKADPGQVEQVIVNLVVNARDAMPNGGRIVIETSNAELDANYAREHVTVRPGPYVLLAVSDTGMGMTAETISHIFEPFYTTKESGRGTGLGLSTVYGIVKQSGGYIWVYSELGKGSSFKVYLPRVEEAVSAVKTEGPASATGQGHETILLVEDEPAVRELTHRALGDRGYTVIEAASPEEAEQLAERHGTKIHLLLTDVVMAGMSGRELAKRLTARYPSLHVLYMSGYTYNVIAEDGTLEEGLSFLQKPFTPQTLTQKVREALDGTVHAR